MKVQKPETRTVMVTEDVICDLTGESSSQISQGSQWGLECATLCYAAGYGSDFDGLIAEMDVSGNTAVAFYYLALARKHGSHEEVAKFLSEDWNQDTVDRMRAHAERLVTSLQEVLATSR